MRESGIVPSTTAGEAWATERRARRSRSIRSSRESPPAETSRMGRCHGGVLALLLACTGCWSIDSADLVAIGAEHELALTEAELGPEVIDAIASVHVAKNGFYLFGLAPIVRVSLDEAIDELAERARRLGADGVCNIDYTLSPPNPLKFVVFPIPDWGARVQVFGMAYRTKSGEDVATDSTGSKR